MKTPRCLLLVPALLVCAASASASPNVQTTRLYLTRPALNAPDLDAKGSVLVRSWNGGDRELLEVKVGKVAGPLQLELWIADDTQTLAFVGNLSLGATKSWKADTGKGQALPFDDTLAELAGRPLEVRLGTDVLLSTMVPAFVQDNKTKSAHEHLDVAPGSPNKGAHGVITVTGNDQSGVQFIRVKAKGLGFKSFNYIVWIENDVGTMVPVAALDQYALNKGRFVRNTRVGSPLPLGVLYVHEIIGRKIEVRDQNDTVYLEEFVPPLD